MKYLSLTLNPEENKLQLFFLILKLFFFQPKTSLQVVRGRHVRRLLRLGELRALKQVCKR
jgi:hypothetical protein